MDARIRRSGLFSIVATLTVACSAASTVPPSVASPSTVAVVTDGGNGISFTRPASWTRWVPNAHDAAMDGPLVYLSTDPLLPTCARTPPASPNPADARGLACEWPLTQLAPNGVLVIWLTTRFLAPLPSAGAAVEVNGATARLQTKKPGTCSAVGADETLEVFVPIGLQKPWSNIAVDACLRGPDLATSEAQVRAMLASATVSP